MKKTVESPEAVAKQMMWLAWQACGAPLGMGVLQDAPKATKEDVWQNVITQGDYQGRPPNANGAYYADYVFGRMMKLSLQYDDGTIELPDREPTIDYQSWSRKYPTYESLFNAAVMSLSPPSSLTTE